MKIIDFHTHIFPMPPIPESAELIRTTLKHYMKPISQWQHWLQAKTHTLPSSLRRWVDELGMPMVVPHMLIEATANDLVEEMAKHEVVRAVVVAHPPLINNNFVFYEAKRHENLIPCVFLDHQSIFTADDLIAFWDQGVRLFKVNPIVTGLEPENAYYKPLLEYLNFKRAVVILHTGEIQSQFFKAPSFGRASTYEGWLKKYPDIKFLAAHMNFHEPDEVIQLAQDYEHLSLICSWQGEEAIEKAVKELGSERVFFGSDWPLLGDNISVQKTRILNLVTAGKISEHDAQNIFFNNAEKLLTGEGLKI